VKLYRRSGDQEDLLAGIPPAPGKHLFRALEEGAPDHSFRKALPAGAPHPHRGPRWTSKRPDGESRLPRHPGDGPSSEQPDMTRNFQPTPAASQHSPAQSVRVRGHRDDAPPGTEQVPSGP